jgi:hypothetical protein
MAGQMVRATWILAAVAAVALVAMAAALPPHGFFAGDSGVKLIVARNVAAAPAWPPRVVLPVIDGRPAPQFLEPFFVAHDDHAHGVTSSLLPVLSAPLITLFGLRGAYLIPLLSFAATVPLLALVQRRAGLSGSPWMLGIVTIAAGPLLFYGLELWEHAPAVAALTAFTALACGTRRIEHVAGGACAALAILFRPEAVWYVAAVWLAMAWVRRLADVLVMGGAAAIGVAMDLGLVLRRLPEVMLLVVALLAAKAVVLAALCRAFGERPDVALRVGLLLAQGGEFGFVLFGAAMAAGLLLAATGQLLLAAIALSMAVTPALAALGARLSARMAPPPADDRAALGEAAGHLADHVLIAGFGRVGQTVARLLAASGIPYLALDLDHARVTTCRAKGMPVFYGDAERIDVLAAAGVERARAAVITMDRVAAANHAVAALRAGFPDLRVYARAHGRRHARLLTGRGATAAVPEAIEASLQLGGIVLEYSKYRKLSYGRKNLHCIKACIHFSPFSSLAPLIAYLFLKVYEFV